ncbi:hypothetical protein [Sphingomonas alba]|uniref:Restriction endonuclease n=1 Tax=Sphingomonas alba TaxID=2908208 RepID=A0ABT0RN61_9SPHN|nr:hypothetical protein [Sphingomonas alba]MCL6684094.1 hypothetical protein [Sphingomonas alba]
MHSKLIPEFCGEAGRNCQPDGFVASPVQVSDVDARYFLMAIEAGLLEHLGCGRYKAAASSAFEQFFWEGRKALEPRPFTLWLEPVITVAGLARLHFDHGWPKESIGTQSADFAFDLVTFLPGNSTESIAGEVKKTAREIDDLVTLMVEYGRAADIEAPTAGKERNAYMKVAALRRRRPPIFWALGPDGLSRVFKVQFGAGDVVELVTVSDDQLNYTRTL